jgi:hypothetical protein
MTAVHAIGTAVSTAGGHRRSFAEPAMVLAMGSRPTATKRLTTAWST